MPVIPYTSNHPAFTTNGISGYRWDNLANGDTGTPLEIDRRTDRSIQVNGTFGAGGTVVIEGSLDGTNYVTLSDLQGTALSFTAAGLEGVTEAVTFIRPRVSAGDGTTSLDVFILSIGL